MIFLIERREPGIGVLIGPFENYDKRDEFLQELVSKHGWTYHLEGGHTFANFVDPDLGTVFEITDAHIESSPEVFLETFRKRTKRLTQTE